MKTLVLGATGATGKQVVDQLVSSGETVKAVVSPSSSPPSNWSTEDAIEIIRTQISELSVDEMAEMLQDCNAIAKGIQQDSSIDQKRER